VVNTVMVDLPPYRSASERNRPACLRCVNQFCCMMRTFSGHPESLSKSRSNSSAYFVMRKKPLFQFALLDGLILMPPTHPAHDLLVRQHGRALRTPVHPALFAIRQSRLIQLQKKH